MLLANEFTYWAVRISEIGFDGWVRNHMPLHVCGVAVLLTTWTLLFRSERTYEIVYFWGLVGAANAVLTPGGLAVDFPQYRFFQYFIAHSGIVTGVLFATWGLGMRPTLRGMFRAFGYLAGFAAFVAVANLLLGSNFMWLSAAPPGTVSPFFAAPWPWYLPILAVVGFTMFFVVLSPFLVSDWWRKRTGLRRPERSGARSAPGHATATSVREKSSPLKRRGSRDTSASAYAKQSPKFSPAG